MSEQRGSADLIRYLLNELPEDQIEQIEQKYFSSDESFEEVEHAEAELIDLYVSGELEPREKEKFEKLYLSTSKHKERVQFAEALRRKAADTKFPQKQTTSWPFAAKLIAAALVLFALAGIWLIYELIRVRNENAMVHEQLKKLKQSSSTLGRQQEKIQELTKELDAAQMQEDTNPPQPIHGSKPQPVVMAIVMTPGLVRDASGMKTLNIPADTDFLRFELKLDQDPFSHYRVSLQTAGGDELWGLGLLKPSSTSIGKTIVFDLPASKVQQRDYVLLLQGKSAGTKLENVSAYPFRVRIAS
jgi:hypothetical protein